MGTRAIQLAQGLLISSILFMSALLHEPAESGESPESAADGAFSRSVLLGRFDRDGDGRLDADERAALRDAFGGIDVPMLPAKPLKYTGVDRVRSAMSAEELRHTDNTPADNPMTDAGALLGRVLFYDRQLSGNNTVSCASCHHQDRGFADPRTLSVGFEGGLTARNAMSLANLRYSNLRGLRPGFFWDERAPTLEAQALMPIQDELEMGMKLPDLERRLQKLPYYPDLFAAAFGSSRVTSRRIARAVAQFMRSLVSFDSKFDRSARKQEKRDYFEDFDGFTAQENLGKSLFIEGVRKVAEFGCAFCHIPPTFGMPKSFNNGLDAKYKDRGLGTLDRPSNDPFTPSNDGKFKAPPLRNVERSAPYMHDGRFETLEQVVDHYSDGVHAHANVSLAFADEKSVTATFGSTSGFKFTAEQKAALVAFLKTLTDEDFVSDPRFSDPFIRTEAGSGLQPVSPKR